jgi:predicted ATP-binding protein involved in virulence
LGLKVDYLKLKNFNAIFSTLNLKKIEIDFTKMQNSILLFIGTNGSCKTYILSHIHPFAYVGWSFTHEYSQGFDSEFET